MIETYEKLAKDYRKHFDLKELIESAKAYLPKFDEPRFLSAFEFAANAHEGQMRKDGTTPYIAHPVAAAMILTHIRADEDVLISALMHDVPEDTPHDVAEIRALFGENVAFLVDGITKLSKVQYQHDMSARQVESLRKLFVHSAKDPRIILIKLADRLHNMQTLHNIQKPEKRLRIAKETLEIYVPIANLLGLQFIKNRLSDLCFEHLFPTEYQHLKNKMDTLTSAHKAVSDSLTRIVKTNLRREQINGQILEREKNLYKIYKKLSKEGKLIDELEDRVSMKVIVDTEADCYRALGVIHGIFTPKSSRFRDYIANPKINGYQSLHTAVFGIDGLLTEFQIRTRDMDREAEFGIAASFFHDDKLVKSASETVLKDRRSVWMTKILEFAKEREDNKEFIEGLKSDIFKERISVFSPKGRRVDLPLGASAIDFAYMIHKEVGNKACKVEIDGQIKPITTALKMRNVVNIITDERAAPELYWLSFAKTNLARNSIRAYLKKASKKKKVASGRKILQHRMDILGLGEFENINFKKLNPFLIEGIGKSFKKPEDLLAEIGDGTVKAASVVVLMQKALRMKQMNLDDGFKVDLKIVAKNRFGLLREVSEILYKYSVDMTYLKGWSSYSNEYGIVQVQVVVDDLENVNKIFDELQQLDDIQSVYRRSSKGLFLFYLTALSSVAIWVLHPMLLQVVVNSEFAARFRYVTDAVLYAGFFVTLVMALYIVYGVKKYFPLQRQKDILWKTAFSALTISFVILILEMFYLDVTLNWYIILLGVIGTYFYLGYHYSKFRKRT